MPHFTLMRYRNGDLILSAGSRLPVEAAVVGSAIADLGAPCGDAAHLADPVLDAGNGMHVEAAT
jgi:hypothetical protein